MSKEKSGVVAPSGATCDKGGERGPWEEEAGETRVRGRHRGRS